MGAVYNAYNAPPQPANLDRIGIFFLSFVSVWTSLVIAGMVFLIIHRNEPIIKIRGIYLSLASVCMLQPYWALGHMVYPVFPTMNIIFAYDLQFFFMGIWLPLGIALFHASNLRFLHVAKLQEQYAQSLHRRVACNSGKKSLWSRVQNMTYSTKVIFFICIGIIVQVLLTIGTWLMCRKYHPTFGIPGTELPDGTAEEQKWWLGQGWDWWLTLFWQFLWTWIVAPFLIIRAWNIEDTLGWRLQTIGCCISSLHATPMYLIASYVPAFKPINKYFTPSNWIHLSIMFFVIFTVFVPCWQIISHQRLRKKTIDSNAKREFESRSTLTAVSVTSIPKISCSLSLTEEGNARVDILGIDDDRLLTMSALDHVLRTNPTPLQDFSALRDFSGENIAFLVRATQWKPVFFESLESEDQRQDVFIKALEIYTTFISQRNAPFPINLSWRQFKPLGDIFEDAARTLYDEPRQDSAALPFDFEGPPTRKKNNTQLEIHEVTENVRYSGPIPQAFNPNIFDDAVAHVRELVFLNTWPKFVRELRIKRPTSSETQRSDYTWSSNDTFVEKTVGYFKGLFGKKAA